MNELQRNLECKICAYKYNADERRPLILQCCGQTICKKCILDQSSQGQSATFRCPFSNHALNQQPEAFTTNFAVLDMLGVKDESCIECGSVFKINDTQSLINCHHCDRRLCKGKVCLRKHFDEFMKQAKKNLDERRKRLENLKENANEMVVNANVDYEFANQYTAKHLSQIKNHAKRVEIEHKVNKYLDEQKRLVQLLQNEAKTLDDKLKRLDEIEKKDFVEATNIATALGDDLSKNPNPIAILHRLIFEINSLDYTPLKIELKDKYSVDIENREYFVDNIVLNQHNDWLAFELNVTNLDSTSEPEDVFSTIKQDLLDCKLKGDVVMAVLGRGGVGKSAFVNSFFNSTAEQELIRVDVGISTAQPKAYSFSLDGQQSLILWDTPGVFSRNFSLDNFKEMLKRNPNFNAFLYIYDTHFNEEDNRIVELLKNTGKPIIYCRNKVENDFKATMERKLKKSYIEITKQERQQHYKSTFSELKNTYEEDRRNNYFLRGIDPIFYVSSKQAFREWFEWNDFMTHLRASLPKVKQNILLNTIKSTSLQLLAEKKETIKREIKDTLLIKLNELYVSNEYKKYLNFLSDQVRSFYKRLGIDCVLKEFDENISKKIEEEIDQQLMKRKDLRANLKSEKADSSLKYKLFFKLPASMGRNYLMKMTEKFLMDQLEILYQQAHATYSSFMMNKIRQQD